MNHPDFVGRDRLPAFLKLPYTIYKWLFIAPFLVLSTTVLGLLITVISFLGAPNFASRVFATLWARLNSAVSMMSVKVKGHELVDPNQSYVIVANHQSLIDIYALYGFLNMEIKWVMKKELRAVPVLGMACEAMGHIIIDRSNTEAALKSINDARDRINNGVSVVFFPEGTRSRSGELKPFKKGAFRFAQELGLPILPVVIHGTNQILPSDGVDLMPGQASLEFCSPIETAGMSPDDVTELSRRARSAIFEKLKAADEAE